MFELHGRKGLEVQKPISLGLIGVGRHGKRYLHHLLSEDTGGTLVAISRKNHAEGLHLAAEHPLRFYPNYRDLLADRTIQAVLIVTPPSLNFSIASEAIKHGKAVLIEKPLALNSTDGHQIIDAANKARIPLMTAHTLRYEPAIRTLQDIGSSLGTWKYLSCTMRFENHPSSSSQEQAWQHHGSLMEFGIHLLDLVHFLTQDTIRTVSAHIPPPFPQKAEEQAFITLTTHGGLPCYLDISRVSQGRVTRAEIIGSNGQALADWTTGLVQKYSQENQKTDILCPPSPTLVALLKDFVLAIRTGGPMPITGEDGLRAVELAEACYQAAKTGQLVHLS